MTRTSRASSSEQIALRLLSLERSLRALRTPQLSHSSVEGGTLDFNDDQGNLMMQVGQHADGTAAPVVVGGPTPPGITGVTAEPTPAGIMVRWDGSWLGDLGVAPLDFSRVEIHASHTGADFEPELVGDGSLTMQGSIASPRGGRFAITGLSYENYWVKLVPRTLTGKWGEATEALGPITPGRLSQGDLDETVLAAGFILTGVIQVGAIGQPNPLIISGTEGFVAPQPDGGEIRFPVDGSMARITAQVIAYKLVVKDNLEIYGKGNISGSLTLSDTVRPPTDLPRYSEEWPMLDTALRNGNEDTAITNRIQGITDHHAEADWLVSANTTMVGQSRVTSLRLWHRVTGLLTAYPDPTNPQPWVWNFESIGGICRVGSSYFILGVDRVRKRTLVYRISGTTWEKTFEWQIGDSDKTFVNRPRLVSDGTRVGVVWVPTSGNLMLRWYTTTGSISGSDVTLHPAYPAPADLGDAHYGIAGAGSARLYVASVRRGVGLGWGDATVRAYDPAAGTPHDGLRSFSHAGGAREIIGMHYDSQQERMVSLDASCTLSTYSKFALSTTLTVGNTWYDGDNNPYPPGTVIGGTDVSGIPSGEHETTLGPTESQLVSRRAWPVFEFDPPPDEKVVDPAVVDRANRIGVYVKVDAGPMVRHAYLTNTGGMAQRILRGVDVFATSGSAPPATNTFASAKAQPGILKSTSTRADGSPDFCIEGSGAGRFDAVVGPGMMMFFPYNTGLPENWLLCNGQNVSRTTYVDLFNMIGTTFGAGNGTTTFTLPTNLAPSGLYLVIRT